MLSPSCSKLLNLNPDTLRDNYNSWGPSAHLCISLTKDPDEAKSHIWSLDEAAYHFITDDRFDDFTSLESSLTHRLFVVRPANPSRRRSVLQFATNHIREVILRTYASHDHAVQLTFYKLICNHPQLDHLQVEFTSSEPCGSGT